MHKVDDSKPAVMDTIRPVRDVRIKGQTQAALVMRMLDIHANPEV